MDTLHDATGLSALHIAIGTSNLPLVRYLVEERRAWFGADKFGRWPTVIAAECRATAEICDYIAEQEAAALADEDRLLVGRATPGEAPDE